MDQSCIFCLIACGEDQEAEVIKQSKDLVCFRDICPAAPHHYLVIPRKHIQSCLSLDRRHVSLVERMVQMGKAALQQQGITDMTDIRLGFHQPPFISVNHLHLHVLAPASQITDLEYKFIPRTPSFVEEDHLRRRIKNFDPHTGATQSSLKLLFQKAFPS